MCDTLTLSTKISSLKYEPIKSLQTSTKDICEPDNGHKADSTSKLDLELVSERLKTFTNWKNDAVTPKALAEAGFYFLNVNYDLVRCVFCKVEISSWENGDDPLEEHAKWSPNCSYVKANRKMPLFSALPAGQDECGSRELFPNSVPEKQTFKLLKYIRSHEDRKSRLETFTDWPKSLKQKPARLADAGFYYKGVGDQVVCFECGGGLKDWEDGDDPWEQHALWFPRCPFLQSEKGQKFVDEVHSRLRPDQQSGICTKEASATAKNKSGAAEAPEDSSKSCKICYNNGIEVVFIPCGHLLACVECALSMGDVCPVCRKRIEATLRVFPS